MGTKEPKEILPERIPDRIQVFTFKDAAITVLVSVAVVAACLAISQGWKNAFRPADSSPLMASPDLNALQPRAGMGWGKNERVRHREFIQSVESRRRQVRNILAIPELSDDILATYDFHVLTEDEIHLIYGDDILALYGRDLLYYGEEEPYTAEQHRAIASAYIATANYYFSHLGGDSSEDYLAEMESEIAEAFPNYQPSDAEKTMLAVGGFGRKRVAVGGKPDIGSFGEEREIWYETTFGGGRDVYRYMDGYLDEFAAQPFLDAIDGDKIHISEAMLEIFELTQRYVWVPEIVVVVDDEDATSHEFKKLVSNYIQWMPDAAADGRYATRPGEE